MFSRRLRGSAKVGIWAIVCSIIVMTPRQAVACACCAEAGTWSQETRRLTPEELSEIGRLNLGHVAQTVVSAAGLEEIKGIRAAAPRYALRHLRPNREWRLDLQGDGRSAGTLTFVIPDRAVLFAVDLQGGENDPAGGVILYKEWRLSGPVTGTGAFKSGTFHLVFQGRGNACPDADRFTGWILRVEGSGVSYALHGVLDLATPRPGTIYVAAVAASREAAVGIAAAAPLRRGDLFFTSPEEAVRTLTTLLRNEDWRTISRYYDLTFTEIDRGDLESGRFFLHERRPEGAHPALPWKYKHPFTPGFRFQGVEATSDPRIVRVLVGVEIDQGGGMLQRVRSEFQMRRHPTNGYQIMPPQ